MRPHWWRPALLDERYRRLDTPVKGIQTTSCVLLLLLAGCGGGRAATGSDAAPTSASPPPGDGAVTVAVDPENVRANAAFFEAVADDAFRYYRFVNVSFSAAVCAYFGDDIAQMPYVNLHGDAHVEQYAITSVGRGLADFDDSSTGPAVVDLVRFGASLDLAARAHGWTNRAALLDRFLAGYRASLRDGDYECEEPALAATRRATFADDRSAFLAEADSLMRPLDAPTEAQVLAAFRRYVGRMTDSGEWGEDHFSVRGIGGLEIGIGSRLDQKFLVRVEGDTPDPLDDVILELKEVRDLSGIPCVDAGASGSAFRVLIGQARIGGDIDPYLAPVPAAADGIFERRPFWARAWFDHYYEVSVDDLTEPADLEAIAYDVGVQLGRGHVVQIAAPLDAQLRVAQLELLDRIEPDVIRAIAELAEGTVLGWEKFRTEVSSALAGP